MFKEKYPKYKLDDIPYNHPEVIDPVYSQMLTIAEDNKLNINDITDIYDKGTDYIATKYSWEITGWWWQQNNLNELIDGLDNNDVDSVRKIVNKYDDKTFEERKSIYMNVIQYIK